MSKTSEITILLDRSGSMGSIRESTVKGVNEFIETVQKEPGEGRWTFVQFDDPGSAKGAEEPFPYTVFENKSDSEVNATSLGEYKPRGCTALIDALYIILTRMKDRYLSAPEDNRPNVLVMIMTDGQENASTLHTKGQLLELTAELQSEKFGFKFLYLGANQDAFAEAHEAGVSADYAFAGYGGGKQYSNSTPFRAVEDDSVVVAAVQGGALAANFSPEKQSPRVALADAANKARAWKAENTKEATSDAAPEEKEEKK